MQNSNRARPKKATPESYSSSQKAVAGLTAFFSLTEEWGLDNEQQRILLGSPGRTTFYEWKKKKGGQLSRDVLDRLSYIVGIYKSVHILFPEYLALEWITNPNSDPMFNGKSPLEYMMSGRLVALSDVRRYLDWARG